MGIMSALMRIIKMVVKLQVVLVALVAVLLGSFFTSIPENLGLFRYLDTLENARGNLRFKGIVPAVHEGPWEFNLSDLPDLTGQTFLVTGANVGLGYWTARHLASKGGHVVMGCRSLSKCQAAASSIQQALPTASLDASNALDLSSFASVAAFSRSFTAQYDSLHSLVLNAGIMRTPFGLTEDGIEQQIGVNHFGHFLLARLLHRVVVATAKKEGQRASIVVVSSSAHFGTYECGVRLSLDTLNDPNTYDAGKAYGQSKLANILFAQELALKLKKFGVLVNSVHPGGVKTDLARHMLGDPSSSLSQSAGLLLERVLWSPEVAALTQLYAAVGPRLFERQTSGVYFHPIARATTPDPHASASLFLQEGLWRLSEQVLSSKAWQGEDAGTLAEGWLDGRTA